VKSTATTADGEKSTATAAGGEKSAATAAGGVKTAAAAGLRNPVSAAHVPQNIAASRKRRRARLMEMRYSRPLTRSCRMQRSRFVKSLVAAVGIAELTHVVPALALDEAQIGREVFEQLRDDGDLLFDSPFYEHLNEIGSVISATVKDRYPYPIQYHVVKGDSANAFSVPGGNIYVNEPLLRMAKNRDELAGVLAHETGHMVLHHVAKRIANANASNIIGTILSIPAQVILGPLGGLGAEAAMNQLQNAQDANVSRHIEAQADEEGARIMAASGVYNPYGLIWFFDQMTKRYGDKGTFWSRSHPFDSARITDLKTLFAANPQVFAKYDRTDRQDEVYW
jgi:predicted Zn-dependent protease